MRCHPSYVFLCPFQSRQATASGTDPILGIWQDIWQTPHIDHMPLLQPNTIHNKGHKRKCRIQVTGQLHPCLHPIHRHQTLDVSKNLERKGIINLLPHSIIVFLSISRNRNCVFYKRLQQTLVFYKFATTE